MKKIVKNKKGFTLVEIIVVLIIMGILLAIAVPSVMGYVSRAEEQRDLATAHTGFVGAQTVVLQERAENRDATDLELATAITATSVEAEITPTELDDIRCVVDEGIVTQCSIRVTATSDWANYVANGTAEMDDNPTVTGPNIAP